MTGRLTYEIDPTPDGAVLRQRETLQPHGPLRLMAGAMDRMLRPRLETRLRDIRALLEKTAA